jgi:hypothetical protein
MILWPDIWRPIIEIQNNIRITGFGKKHINKP